ncbi:MAG: hypothetical protein PHX86_02040 [Caldisericia bacterium]|nr:hypothetical protein [Caldisericia bacterium]
MITKLPFQVLTNKCNFDVSFQNVYASDLLSNALASVNPETAWITVQVHQNILGIASIKQCPVVIFSEGAVPDDSVISLAEEKDIFLLTSSYPTFELSGLLYRLLKEE